MYLVALNPSRYSTLPAQLSTTSPRNGSPPFHRLALCCEKTIANKPVTPKKRHHHTMVTLQFTYHEIMDSDWAAIDLAVLENGQPLAAFRNYNREELTKEIYGNQTETFELPDLVTALRMIASNGSYVECPVETTSN